MPTARNIKLGLLTLVVVGAVVVTAIVLGLRSPPRDLYTTYFDESVHGLEAGAPVKYRGIMIGRVEDIELAPDGKQVAVEMAIRSAFAERIGLDAIARQLRAQLVLQSISGLKLVEIAWARPDAPPPLALGFEPPENYIPSQPSMLAELERGVRGVERKIPEVFERVSRTLERVEELLADLRTNDVAGRIATASEAATETLREVRELVQAIDRANLPARTARVLRSLDAVAAKADRILDRVGGDRGLVATTARAANTIDEVGAGVLESVGELERTLRSVNEAARAMRELLLLLEREPDILVKGRRRPAS